MSVLCCHNSQKDFWVNCRLESQERWNWSWVTSSWMSLREQHSLSCRYYGVFHLVYVGGGVMIHLFVPNGSVKGVHFSTCLYQNSWAVTTLMQNRTKVHNFEQWRNTNTRPVCCCCIALATKCSMLYRPANQRPKNSKLLFWNQFLVMLLFEK